MWKGVVGREPGYFIVPLTLLATGLRVSAVDTFGIQLFAIPVMLAILVFVGYVGVIEIVTTPRSSVAALVGPFACMYIGLRRVLSYLLLTKHEFIDSTGVFFPDEMLWAIAVAYFLTVGVLAMVVGRECLKPANLYLLLLGSCAVPIAVVEACGEKLRWWSMQVTSANPLCIWASIACAFALVALVKMKRRNWSALDLTDVRFAGGLISCVGALIVIVVLSHAGLANVYTSDGFALDGVLLLIAGGLIVWFGVRGRRRTAAAIVGQPVTYRDWR